MGLSYYWDMFSIPQPVEEYVFYPGRKWRFDYCWPKYKIACEMEGGVWIRGRHNRPIGYKRDLEKYNRAAADGWMVFRFTPDQFKNGEAGSFLEDYFTQVVFKNGS